MLGYYFLFNEGTKGSLDITYSPSEDVYANLLQGPDGTIYYMAEDGRRYVFPNEGTYQSWFGDHDDITQKTLEELYETDLGGNVYYRPGSKILITESYTDYYFISNGGVLKPFANEEIIEQFYGSKWIKQVDEIENHFFTNYHIGSPINSIEDLPTIIDNVPLEDNLLRI